MAVVATAGHVDHGKSTLVRALTGRDPDRLEEEHRRGLTIELGYCWTRIDGVGEVAFVDVPGHERFLATTLAGLGPVPVVMFVVAADDPWMPQAAEHLAALDLLGVERGVLVVTRSDLADPEPALARARAALAATSLRDVPDVAVSGRTGSGLDRLRALLADQLAGAPAPDPAADVRLWVDRVFPVRGAGTVVTGTLPQGTVAVGDSLAVRGATVRVRGIESLEQQRTSVSGVSRVALNLVGGPDLARGDVLTTPSAFVETTLVDVALRGPERLPERPVLHVGSAHLGVHARLLDDGFARLRLERRLPLRPGDRLVVRDPGSRELWGARVLDPMPPELERRGDARRRAKALAGLDGSVEAELALRGVIRRSDLRRLGLRALPAGSVEAAGWVLSAGHAQELSTRLTALVGEHRRLPAPRAAQLLGLPDPALVAPLAESPLRWDRAELVSGDAAAEGDDLVRRLRDELAANPFGAPEADRLHQLGLDKAVVARLHRDGRVLRLAENVVLLPEAEEEAVARLRTLPQPFGVSQARQVLGTTRRVALPLLAHLDRHRRTLRLPDDRRVVMGRGSSGITSET